MNLKSLLIGSAAALVAAPAFAADVIIAEPEPVEYVEVCDVAGAGYFYIPGSRTCLQISGLVRHQLDFAGSVDPIVVSNFSRQLTPDVAGVDAVTLPVITGNIAVPRGTAGPANGVVAGVAGVGGSQFLVQPGETLVPGQRVIRAGVGTQEGYDSLVRAEVRFRTFTETELGDLTSDIRFRANSKNANRFSAVATTDGNSFNTTIDDVTINNSVSLQNATIGLGGLLFGLTDSLTDYGIPGEFDSFGGDRVHTIRYTADLGPFSASLGAELELADRSQTDYVPNIVASVSGDIGPFALTASVGYDDADDVLVTRSGVLVNNQVVDVVENDRDDAFSVKAVASFDIGFIGAAIGATYNSDANYYDNGYEYSAGASGTIGLGEKASLTFGGQYFFNQLVGGRTADFVNLAGLATANDFGTVNSILLPRGTIDGIDKFSVGANLDYEIVDGFDVKLALNYEDLVIDEGEFATAVNNGNTITDVRVDDGDGQFKGFIRFDRSF